MPPSLPGRCAAHPPIRCPKQEEPVTDDDLLDDFDDDREPDFTALYEPHVHGDGWQNVAADGLAPLERRPLPRG